MERTHRRPDPRPTYASHPAPCQGETSPVRLSRPVRGPGSTCAARPAWLAAPGIGRAGRGSWSGAAPGAAPRATGPQPREDPAGRGAGGGGGGQGRRQQQRPEQQEQAREAARHGVRRGRRSLACRVSRRPEPAAAGAADLKVPRQWGGPPRPARNPAQGRKEPAPRIPAAQTECLGRAGQRRGARTAPALPCAAAGWARPAPPGPAPLLSGPWRGPSRAAARRSLHRPHLPRPDPPGAFGPPQGPREEARALPSRSGQFCPSRGFVLLLTLHSFTQSSNPSFAVGSRLEEKKFKNHLGF